MRNLGNLGLVLLIGLATVLPVLADDASDVEGLVNGACAMFTEQGKEAALKAINSRQGPFVRGDLYVFAVKIPDNVVLAHPFEHSIRGVCLNGLEDAAGMKVFRKFQELAQQDGGGWLQYMWSKPGSKDPSPKRTYVKKVPNEDVYVGAGYYLKNAAAAP
jgi:signal transduction histidine kinase